uniref:Uncharacterized protein n=1 Tax=Solanum tuberosum TaxID=4113 RepID=M1DUI0_SOLTU
MIFSLPVWVEAAARFRRLEEDQRNSRDISHRLERESTRDKSSNSRKVLMTYRTLGLQREGIEPLDKEPLIEAQDSSLTIVNQSIISEVKKLLNQQEIETLGAELQLHGGGENLIIRGEEDNEEEVVDQGTLKKITLLGDPTTICFDVSGCSEEAGEQANLWVQNNIRRLSQEFGVAFEGCIEESTTLFLKIDQRREKEAPTSKLNKKSGQVDDPKRAQKPFL